MKEERVTINIINWMESNGWKIISYDFPQSGTGVILHPNLGENRVTKNKNGIIPDILATKDSVALLFENKDRFVFSDFEKIKEIKLSGKYTDSLKKILDGSHTTEIYYGIGIPEIERHIKKSLDNISYIDFLISTNEYGDVKIHFDKYEIFCDNTFQ